MQCLFVIRVSSLWMLYVHISMCKEKKNMIWVMHFCFWNKMEDARAEQWGHRLALVRPAAMYYWVWSSAGGTTHTLKHSLGGRHWGLGSQGWVSSGVLLLLLNKLVWHQWKQGMKGEETRRGTRRAQTSIMPNNSVFYYRQMCKRNH